VKFEVLKIIQKSILLAVIPLKNQFAYSLRVSTFWKLTKNTILFDISTCIHTGFQI